MGCPTVRALMSFGSYVARDGLSIYDFALSGSQISLFAAWGSMVPIAVFSAWCDPVIHSAASVGCSRVMFAALYS